MKTNFLIAIFFFQVCTLAPNAVAENPGSARTKVRLIERQRAGNELQTLRFRVTHTFDADIETDGSCTVQLAGCVSNFVPRGERPDDDSRRCTQFIIGEKTVGEGTQRVRFTTRSFPIREGRRGRAKQLSLQTEAECTDAMDVDATVTASPRAKKVSRIDGKGVSGGDFRSRLVRSFR